MHRLKKAVINVSAVLVAGLLLAGTVRANVFAFAGTGTTSITTSSCYADVYGLIPSVLDVNNGDDIDFYFNVSWSDTRGSGSATHYFNMTISYSRASGDQWASHTVLTLGSGSGTQNMLVTVMNVIPPATIGVSILAQLTSSPCNPNPTQDSASGTVTLV